MKKILLVSALIFFLTNGLIAQKFIGKPGFYYKGRFDIPTPANAYTIPYIDGILILTNWYTIEPSEGIFDWSFIDNEILKAKNNNKDVSIGIIHPPNWIHDSLNAPVYYYVKNNPWNKNNGDTLMGYITWNSIYLNRLDTLLEHLAQKYATDSTVKYINFVSGLITRGFPDSVITATGQSPFWTEFNYDADTILPHLKQSLDRYMTLFPNTPLWSSIDYVKFEMHASGNPPNYLISQYVDYGVDNYPDRFGLWKEDLAGCIDWGIKNPGSTWYTMAQYSCRHGSQMLWHVQDGPYRMNKCNIAPSDSSATSKIAVMDSTFALGMSMGMRYFEIYPIDLNDADLQGTFINRHNQLDTMCQGTTSIFQYNISKENASIYPNPTNGYFRINLRIKYKTLEVIIYNTLGKKVGTFNNQPEIDITHLPPGSYFLKIRIDKKIETEKILKLE